MSYIYEAIEALNALEEDRSSKSTIKSALRVMLTHMLKCKYQPEYKNKNSWFNSILNSYEMIDDEFPSINKGTLYKRFYLKDLDLDRIYQQARIKASNETGKDISVFPISCEWTKQQLIDYQFIDDFIKQLK